MSPPTGVAETWVVTGAARGIGLAVVRALLARGDAALACCRAAPPAELVDLQTACPQRLRLATFDLRDDEGVARAASQFTDTVDVLFNNAGVYGPRSPGFRGLDRAGTLDAVDVNALGALRVIDAFLPHLQAAARPRIVAVSSLMGAMSRPGTGSLAYRISKAALNKLMQTVGVELRPQGIALACLRPGSVTTRMNPTPGQATPAESAAAMLAVVDALRLDASPQFLDIDGTPLAW